ncbi:hypothetical protein BN8_00236 [Fibrisoma limi BUZ 3]|uniref:DUF3575 domain-containing protein n=2 Tax=Fibrisoma limi TaxID=663275 RepID=I2GBP4_9BACT|nr:hypothetical protein BN8_00236 [Fibrisoma limi BUZ 3]
MTDGVMKMKQVREALWVFFLLAQSMTGLSQGNGKSAADTTGAIIERPTRATLIAETDQRFFFFSDSRNEANRWVPINVWGARVGMLLPAAYKIGLGVYYANQRISKPGLIPETSASVRRQLRYLTAYYEPYLFRKKLWELSLLTELGWGYSQYERVDNPALEQEIAKGNFMPAGLGVSFSVKLPPIRGFRPIHWFGVNFLSGYRFILKKDIPASQINYNGLYYSIGPAFFLDRFTADFRAWNKQRKERRNERKKLNKINKNG